MEKIISRLELIGEKLNKASVIFLGVQMIILSIAVVGQVFLRFFGTSINWATEFSCYLFIWMTMLGSAVASKYLMHIGVDILVERIRGKARKIVLLISHLLFLAGLLIFITAGMQYTVQQIASLTVTFGISKAWFYVSMPVCGMLMAYYTFVQLLEIIHYDKIIIPKENPAYNPDSKGVLS